jgi:hypothetical protein
MTKCKTPRTNELTTLQAELATAQNVSGDVIAEKTRAATWDKLAKTLGSTPDELQVKLAFARAILLEIIAPIFVSIFLSAYRNRLPTAKTQERVINSPEPIAAEQRTPAQPPPVQQPTGYKVTGLKL